MLDQYLDAALVLDNCDPAPTLTDDAPANHLFPVGTTTVTYTAVDEAGNRATAQTTVTVTPWIPALSAQGPRVLNVPDQGVFTASGGQQPYTWTVSDPAIAKIVGETTGASVTVEGVGPGYCTVSVHDSCSQEVHLSLTVAQLIGPSDARTCVNHDVTLTAKGEPVGGTCGPLLWSCDGDPATGDGESFTTKFATPGAHVVTVTYEIEGLQFSAQCTVTAVTVAGISPPGPLTVCRGKTVTFTALSDPEGGFGECEPVWSGTSGASGSGPSIDVLFNATSADMSDLKTVICSCPSNPDVQVQVEVLVVEIEKLQYIDHQGQRADVPATLTVCRDSTVTFIAVAKPADAPFPADCPEWSGTAGAMGTGNPKDVTFATTSEALGDLKTVTAECGGSVTANVLVVEIDRIEGPAEVCRGESGQYTAFVRPAGADFPPGCPTWSGEAAGTLPGERTATVTFLVTSASLTDFKYVEATCGGTTRRGVLVYSVLHVLPDDESFEFGRAGRVLISARMGGGYHTAFQTADGQIRCEAHVCPPLAGILVTFEVIDPDDPSPYIEDSNPETVYTGGASPGTHDIDDPPPGAADGPNDNRDRGALHLRPGTLEQYNTFQGALAGRFQQTDAAGVATTILTITARFAGDDYVVRATCRRAGGMPFNEGSHVTAPPGCDADLPDIDVKASFELQAWKHVYYEMDTMYRRGSFLRHPAPAGFPWIDVRDRTPFHVGDQVRVFDEAFRELTLLRVDNIDPLGHGTAGRLRLSGPLTWGAGVNGRQGAFVGIETGNPVADYFIPDVSALPVTFDDTYVEWAELTQPRSPRVPLVSATDDAELIAFTNVWFDNRDFATAGRNAVYVVGGRLFPGLAGATSYTRNFTYVFLQRAGGTPRPPAEVRHTVNHELVHQFDPGGDDRGGHDTNPAWDNSDQCQMDPGAPNRMGANRLDDLHELCRQHLYQVRDKEDGL